ncbi:MAG: 2Fe-2S iron-sulfur cluster-binding protein [Gammaproteobacteria bacterium]|nr:2Fe-2S iron-sulfur cluster-binding protein [Gammaproteobacteria bacterium]
MDQPEQTILDAALEQRNDIPYSCMGGACGSCRAKLVNGSVDMDQNFALDQSELDAGYVLTCQCHPTSETVVLDYDA